MKHEGLTEQIIGAFFKVYNALGVGFLERVYENALCLELENLGLIYTQQAPVRVRYRGKIVGEYIADVIVENRVIIEVKAVRTLLSQHEAQLLNYLKATEIEVGLILNFGPEPDIVRKVVDNQTVRHA